MLFVSIEKKICSNWNSCLNVPFGSHVNDVIIGTQVKESLVGTKVKDAFVGTRVKHAPIGTGTIGNCISNWQCVQFFRICLITLQWEANENDANNGEHTV